MPCEELIVFSETTKQQTGHSGSKQMNRRDATATGQCCQPRRAKFGREKKLNCIEMQ